MFSQCCDTDTTKHIIHHLLGTLLHLRDALDDPSVALLLYSSIETIATITPTPPLSSAETTKSLNSSKVNLAGRIVAAARKAPPTMQPPKQTTIRTREKCRRRARIIP